MLSTIIVVIGVSSTIFGILSEYNEGLANEAAVKTKIAIERAANTDDSESVFEASLRSLRGE